MYLSLLDLSGAAIEVGAILFLIVFVLALLYYVRRQVDHSKGIDDICDTISSSIEPSDPAKSVMDNMGKQLILMVLPSHCHNESQNKQFESDLKERGYDVVYENQVTLEDFKFDPKLYSNFAYRSGFTGWIMYPRLNTRLEHMSKVVHLVARSREQDDEAADRPAA